MVKRRRRRGCPILISRVRLSSCSGPSSRKGILSNQGGLSSTDICIQKENHTFSAHSSPSSLPYGVNMDSKTASLIYPQICNDDTGSMHYEDTKQVWQQGTCGCSLSEARLAAAMSSFSCLVRCTGCSWFGLSMSCAKQDGAYFVNGRCCGQDRMISIWFEGTRCTSDMQRCLQQGKGQHCAEHEGFTYRYLVWNPVHGRRASVDVLNEFVIGLISSCRATQPNRFRCAYLMHAFTDSPLLRPLEIQCRAKTCTDREDTI